MKEEKYMREDEEEKYKGEVEEEEVLVAEKERKWGKRGGWKGGREWKKKKLNEDRKRGRRKKIKSRVNRKMEEKKKYNQEKER